MARVLARVFGWLLTPVVAWIASFLGAWIAASLTTRALDVRWRIGVVLGAGAIAATLSAVLWLRLLRRSPTLQSALAVHPDGTPVAADAEPDPSDPEDPAP